ncbi:MAG: hypothetical protein HQK55_13030, partial [Deltaproteobacteria bacterium]|nr:hypothetical protein [Deltaproteobacteria bacterium]
SLGPDAAAAANVELGALFSQEKNYATAIDYYSRASAAKPDRSDIYLARGSMYIETKEYAKAEADFQKARQVNPQAAATSQYYLALLSYRQDDLNTTTTRLQQALGQSPDPGLTKQIKSMQEQLGKDEKTYKRWAVITSFSAQYDDNVNLESIYGLEGSRKTKGDASMGINLTGKGYFFNRRTENAGVFYTYRAQLYQTMTANNLTSHSAGAFYSLNADPWFFRAEGGVSFNFVNGKDTVTIYSVTPVLSRLLGENGRIELIGDIERKLRSDGLEDSVHGVMGATYFHTLMPPQTKDSMPLVVRFGGQYEIEEPNNVNTSSRYWTKEVRAGLSFPLPAQLEGDIGITYDLVDYGKNQLLYGDRIRHDHRMSVAAKLGRNITENTRLDMIWTNTNTASNIDYGAVQPYNFTRNVYSLMFTGQF